jgi:hypothetical protein
LKGLVTATNLLLIEVTAALLNEIVKKNRPDWVRAVNLISKKNDELIRMFKHEFDCDDSTVEDDWYESVTEYEFDSLMISIYGNYKEMGHQYVKANIRRANW